MTKYNRVKRKKIQLQQNPRLLLVLLILDIAFRITVFFALMGIVALMIVATSSVPVEIKDAWILVLSALLAVPLGYLRRTVRRRLER